MSAWFDKMKGWFMTSNPNQPASTPCWHCGINLPAHMSAQHPMAKPQPGDLSICGNCGAIHVFNSEIVPTEPTITDLVKVMNSDPEIWARIEQVQRKMAQHKLQKLTQGAHGNTYD